MSDDTSAAPVTVAAPSAVQVDGSIAEATTQPTAAIQVAEAVAPAVAATPVAEVPPPAAADTPATIAPTSPAPTDAQAAPIAESLAPAAEPAPISSPNTTEGENDATPAEVSPTETVRQPFAIVQHPFSLIGTIENEVTSEFVAAGSRAKALITELEGLLSRVEIETAVNHEIASARTHLFNFAASVSRHLGLGG